MNIYSIQKDEEIFYELKEWCKNNPFKPDKTNAVKSVPSVYSPILFGPDNGFYGRKHTPEQIKAWSDMRLGEKNPNYGGKAWTAESLKKLSRPKKNKENYKGSPGKICVINKLGEAIQISNKIYNAQRQSGLPMEEWEFVSTVSKVAKQRRQL